jgi:hypothetical protein
MEIQKIRDLLKDHNQILIDYSDKFIDTNYNVPVGNNNIQLEHHKYLKKYMTRQKKINIKMLFFYWIFQN